MKRARKAAIVVSSDSENENEENSDYEPDVKTKKNPSKKARIVEEKTTKLAKSKTKNKVVESKLLKSKTKENNNCDNLPKKIKATENTNKARNKYLGGGLNDSLYDADPSWVPADVISRELDLDWNVTNTTCEVHKAACYFVHKNAHLNAILTLLNIN